MNDTEKLEAIRKILIDDIINEEKVTPPPDFHFSIDAKLSWSDKYSRTFPFTIELDIPLLGQRIYVITQREGDALIKKAREKTWEYSL